MACVHRVMCGSFLLAFSLALAAQQPVPAQQPSPSQQPDSTQQSDTVYTMDQVPPPPANASAHDLELKGDVLRAEKAFLDAVDYYRAAMKKSDTAVLHNKAGICFLLIRRDHDAKKEFERAIKLDRTYPEAYNNLGALLYNGRKYGPAIKQYKKAIQLSEHNASFHSNLGTAYFSEKDYQNATREYARAMQIDPAIFDRQPSGGVSVKLVSSNDLGHYHYVMAQMFGMHKDEERCRYYLAKANEEGYPVLMALHDNQFAELRKDPEFVTFVRSLKRPPQESQ